MPNDFYTRAYNPLPEQRVSSQVLKDEFARVEAGFDEVQGDANRAIKLPEGTADQTLAMDAGARANLVLAFNASGNITAISYGRYRGDWLTSTAYVVSDYFRDPTSKNIYAVIVGHTSGVLATDIAASKVQLAINVADVETAKTDAQTAASTATTQAGLASTSASTATTQAGIATTKASEASASAGTASTGASTATTQAGIATTKAGEANASAIAAADSAASIAGGPVASVNGRTGVVTGVQDTLVSGTTIKTIGGVSLLGTGNLSVDASLIRSARTSNTMLAAADKGTLIDITSGTFSQTFDAVATLGDGWWCYLRNSGTGDITLDPNSTELIDGLASYVMYPGEARLVQCDGTALRTVVLNAFYKAFTASGTFAKPPGYSSFSGLLWSAGSSGARSGSSSAAPGGAGGGCFPLQAAATSVGATETVTIGAGGVAVTGAGGGVAGGSSSFGTLLSVVQSAIATAGGAISRDGSNGVLEGTANLTGFSGGSSSATVISTIWGGATPGNTAGANAGSSIYGGAAGGGVDGSGVVRLPGASKFGGNGGAAGDATNGTDGTEPGGGGGGTRTGTQSGAGARGELRIWGLI